MLFLLFQLGKDRYALDASRVVEVVPLLELKKIPQSPRGVAGLFVYRGRPMPALDLCELTLNRPAQARLSTRIIVTRCSDATGPEQWLGLVAERATEMIRREARDFVESGIHSRDSTPFHGPVLLDDQGVIQLLHPRKFLTENVRELLFAPDAEASHEPH